jgi:PEP-CTERM motif
MLKEMNRRRKAAVSLDRRLRVFIMQRNYICIAALCAVSLIPPAFGTTFYVIQKDTRFLQTSSSAPSTPDSYDFFATAEDADGVTPLPFTSGMVTGPGVPANIPLTFDGVKLQFSSGVIDLATLNASYPTGDYKFDITNGTTSESVTVHDPSPESFPPIPFVTNFDSLAGLDPTNPFTFTFNAEGVHNAPGLLGFLFIRDTLTSTTLILHSFQPDVTQDTIGANVLNPGTQYQFILFFTNSIVGTNTQLSINNRTSGIFTTAGAGAVPEPGTIAMVAIGIGMVLALKRSINVRR